MIGGSGPRRSASCVRERRVEDGDDDGRSASLSARWFDSRSRSARAAAARPVAPPRVRGMKERSERSERAPQSVGEGVAALSRGGAGAGLRKGPPARPERLAARFTLSLKCLRRRAGRAGGGFRGIGLSSEPELIRLGRYADHSGPAGDSESREPGGRVVPPSCLPSQRSRRSQPQLHGAVITAPAASNEDDRTPRAHGLSRSAPSPPRPRLDRRRPRTRRSSGGPR